MPVIGAGLCGLMTALKYWRKGHNVVGILDRSEGPRYAGDIIVMVPSAICTFRFLPDLLRELEEDRHESTMYYYKRNGELILGPTCSGFNGSKKILPQKIAFFNSELLARADVNEISKDPEKVRLHFPKWLFQHDPEAYVYEKYGQPFTHLVSGAGFHNTNIPLGHQFRPWTIEEVHGEYRNGKKPRDFLDGD